MSQVAAVSESNGLSSLSVVSEIYLRIKTFPTTGIKPFRGGQNRRAGGNKAAVTGRPISHPISGLDLAGRPAGRSQPVAIAQAMACSRLATSGARLTSGGAAAAAAAA